NANDGVHGNELFKLIDVNGAPSGASGGFTTAENTAYTFTQADFGFTDPTDNPPNSLAGVVITSLPPAAAGNLSLLNSPVQIGQLIPTAEIDTGHFQFLPAAGSFGEPAGSFAFQVKD